MRRDIEIHINTEDVVLAATNKPLMKAFRWLDEVSEGHLQSYLYGEVEVSAYLPEKLLLKEGVNVAIDYTPIFKPFMLRFKRIYDDGAFEYVVNPVLGGIWFPVKSAVYGERNNPVENIHASELIRIDEQFYYLYFERVSELIAGETVTHLTGNLRIFSACQMDFNIKRADHQNGNLLLKCVPTNNYRYPLSGVGLIRWTNGDLSQSKLATTIQSEFADDKVIVRSARFNNDTNQLAIDANFDDLD